MTKYAKAASGLDHTTKAIVYTRLKGEGKENAEDIRKSW